MHKLFIIISILFTLNLCSQTWENPLRLNNEWENYGIGDPYIMKYNGLFYLYCSTRDDMTGVKVWSSKDLITWQYEGLCATDAKTKGAYAPEVIQYEDAFYMYTSPAGDGHYVLRSNHPTGPFSIVTGNLGLSIDGSVFKDDDGSLYFYHAGHNGIVGRKMNSPTVIGSQVKLSSTSMNGWTEGPSVIKRNGIYYMIYTGNHVISKGYRINQAMSQTNPLSGFAPDNYQNPAIVNTMGSHFGLGHGTLFRGPNLDEYFTTYHNLIRTYNTGPLRYLNIDRVVFSETRMTILGPNNTTQQAPLLPNFSEYFENSSIEDAWDLTNNQTWTVSEHELLFNSTSVDEHMALSKQIPAFNYTAEFNIAEWSDAEELVAGAIFNYSNNDNYGIAILNKSNNTILTQFKINGEWGSETVATLKGVSKYSAFHSIRIEKQNDYFKFYVDDMLKIEKSQNMTQGKIGYLSRSEKAKFGFCAFTNHINGSSAFSVYKPIPGKLAAVHYNSGGNDVGYHTENSNVNTYRYDSTIIENSFLGGKALKVKKGDWYNYNVKTEMTGNYNIAIGYSSNANCTFKLYENNELIADNIQISGTNGSFRKHISEYIQLTEGNKQIKLEVVDGEAVISDIFIEKDNFVATKEDTFDNRFSRSWKYDDGSWTITDSVAQLDGYGKILMGEDGWKDYSVAVDVKYVSGMNGGIIFRAQNPALGGAGNDPQLGANFFQGYYVTLKAGRIVLGKMNYNYQQLQIKNGSYKINTWYALAVTINGNNIKVFVDDMNEPVIDYNDNLPFISGMAGLRTFNSKVQFDNFKVTKEPITTNLNTQSNINNYLFIAPNPTTENVRLRFPDINSSRMNFSILNMSGKIVLKGSIKNNGVIDVKTLNSGVYLIQVMGEKLNYNGKIVIN